MKMPVTDGHDASELLKADSSLRDIPIPVRLSCYVMCTEKPEMTRFQTECVFPIMCTEKEELSMNMKTFVVCVALMLSVLTSADAEVTIQMVCSEYPPFEFTDENGTVTGFSVELLRAILNKLEMKERLGVYPWKRAYSMALGEKNTLIFSTTRHPKRESLFHWVGPIISRATYLYKLRTRTDIHVTRLEEAKAWQVGAVRGFASEKALADAGFEIDKNLQNVARPIQNVRKLFAGRIDLAASEEFPMLYYVKKLGHQPDEVVRAMSLEFVGDFYYAFNINTDKNFVERFRNAFDKVRAEGIYDEIMAKYTR
ncbi:transporter substrate-binding domain-containing protein [Desulfobacterales bacterium HSG2]|nr:transporter substrate-binding domain-containing protein [Desulfobacterales bacterium HSG2]